MQKPLIKIISKLVFCAFFLITANVIYEKYFLKADLLKYAPEIKQINELVSQKSEVVYIGESSNITSFSTDLDKRTIGEMVSDFYPNVKFYSFTKVASHAGIFYALLKYIPKKSSVKTVIVTMNLRSFTADWIDSKLETSLQKDILLLKNYPPLFNRFLLSFKGYDVKSDRERENQFKRKWKDTKLHFPFNFSHDNVAEWEAWVAKTGIKDKNGKVDDKSTELATHYIKSYAFEIDTLTNPRIKDFDRIVALANSRHWNLVFNLIAENTDMAEELLGKPLNYLMNQNRKLLINRYQTKNILFVDNLNTVRDSEFIDQNWTTEHYIETGRKKIAKNVAIKLRKLYSNKFSVPKQISPTIQTHFSNNCEGAILWEQMQMLSSEEKFSGKRSSKAEPYSITFSYPINQIDTRCNRVRISFKYHQMQANENVLCVLEISGRRANYWTGDNLKKFSKTNLWQKIILTKELPPEFVKGDLIKIYIYNPELAKVYIDDFELNFLRNI